MSLFFIKEMNVKENILKEQKDLKILEKESESHSVVFDSLWPHELYDSWSSSGQNTGGVAFAFSRGYSQHRDWTQISWIAGGFFTSWATREAKKKKKATKLGYLNSK